MLPDRVSNPGPLTYESGALLIALSSPVLEYTELQIRRGTENNSKVIFLFLNKNICCDPSLEPSR